MAVASAGPCANKQTICTALQTDNHTNTSSLIFYRPDALPDTQPTVLSKTEKLLSTTLHIQHAKRSYVDLVAVGVQEQAKDILVPLLLRNCLTFYYIPLAQSLSPTPEQWSLQ